MKQFNSSSYPLHKKASVVHKLNNNRKNITKVSVKAFYPNCFRLWYWKAIEAIIFAAFLCLMSNSWKMFTGWIKNVLMQRKFMCRWCIVYQLRTGNWRDDFEFRSNSSLLLSIKCHWKRYDSISMQKVSPALIWN